MQDAQYSIPTTKGTNLFLSYLTHSAIIIFILDSTQGRGGGGSSINTAVIFFSLGRGMILRKLRF